MISFPNAKINLGLFVTGKRSDGYHTIESIFYPVFLSDILEVIPNDTDDIRLMASGKEIDGDPTKNICIKAFKLLRKEFDIPGFDVYLKKLIPLGAGLGGGSSDGAMMLQMMADWINWSSETEKRDTLLRLAADLGSDCSFFLYNTACFVTGRGEIIEPLDTHLPAFGVAIANPGIHISTKEAFSSIKPEKANFDLRKLSSTPIEAWKDCLRNDFEESATQRYPLIGEMIEEMYMKGAHYAAMTGSGSSVYGLFPPSHVMSGTYREK